MASTYVNDLRLEEIGTGDQSGTWGATTNTNLELIAEAFSFGTEAITTNADTHTTTIADGSTDPGRSMYLKYTGTLDSACTITIGPNTVSKMWFIENGTSGSQNIIISQGSGANITIPPGDVKVVYSDGAGSGAAVVDAFASLSVVDLKVQDDLTVTDDMTVGGTLGVTGIVTLTDDLIIGDGKTIGSASDVDAMTIAANGQITLTQTLIGTALDISGDIDVDGTTNLDVVDIDGAVDMASTLAVGGVLTANAGVVVDNITLDGAEIDVNTNLTIDSAGYIIIDADTDGNIYLNDAGTGYGQLSGASGDFTISSAGSDKDIIFKGNDGGSAIEAMRIDMSAGGNVGIGRTPTAYGSFKVLDLASSSGAIQKLIHTGSTVELQSYASSTVGAVGTATSHPLLFTTADTERMRIDSSGSATFTTGTNDGVKITGAENSAYIDSSKIADVATKGTFIGIARPEDGLFTPNGIGTYDASGKNNLAITSRSDIVFAGNEGEMGRLLSAGGLTFNGDTAAANALNDYEEGTWTPVVKLGTTTVTSTNTGFYTKIGRIITLQVQCGFSNLNSGSGNLTIEGIPFNSADVAHRNHGSVGYYNVADSFGTNGVQARISRNSSFIDFMRSHEISPAQNQHMQSNSELYITITYKNE